MSRCSDIFINLFFSRKVMNMKNLLVLAAVFAVIGTANASLVNNGDFEDLIGTAEGWGFATSGAGGGSATEETAGGNPDGYVTISNPATMWGTWYLSPRENLTELGIPVGETVTFTLDIKHLSGNAASGGLKAESWNSTLADGSGETDPGNIDNSGDVLFTTTGSWASYSYDYTISSDPGVDQVQFVLINVTYVSGSPAEYGYDNARITAGGRALRPIPYVGALLPSVSTAVTFENPAGATSAAAYLYDAGTSPLVNDPNLGPVVFDAGVQTLTVTGESADVTGLITDGHYYYWAVHVDGVQGFTWNFVGSNNVIPTVDAGDDQYLVATASPMVLSLNATVTDDDTPTILWEDISNAGDRDPGTTVTINSSATEDTTVTLTNGGAPMTGWYQFQITVDDGVNPPVVDQVDVGVYADCAAAAAADPLDSYDAIGDLDGSCKVNLVDFALFAGSWLDCDALRVSCP
jgi:hypothetical protein